MAFHGLRVGPQRGRAAPPVATIRRPVGAKDGDALLMENAVVQRPTLPSSIFIAAASASALRRMLVPYRRASWRTSRGYRWPLCAGTECDNTTRMQG